MSSCSHANPVHACADLEMVRLIGVKHFQVFHDRWFVLPPVEKKRQMAIQSGMLLAKWV
jgi:hypothetical protein